MLKTVKAEGVVDHTCLQVALNSEQAPDSKPWLTLKGSLPKEAISAWRSSLEALSAPDEQK